jgi:hypothetical protein
MDENQVAAMMWELSDEMGVGNGPLDAGLASPRMMRVGPDGLFERGYTRLYRVPPESCDPYAVADSGEPVPFFADFLDALVCSGVDGGTIDAVTLPDSMYPYFSGTALCR